MRTERIGVIGAIAGVVLGGLVATAGCVGADDEVSSADGAELHGEFGFHRRHHRPDAGNVGGVAGTTGGGAGPVTGGTTGGGTAGTNGATAVDGGAVADCDICTKAWQCCNVVQADHNCSFSAATCAAMVGDALPAYVNACLTYVVTVRGAWSGNPPAECR
jgi:hypothetical protein